MKLSGFSVCEMIVFFPSNEAVSSELMWFCIHLTFKMADATPVGYRL